MEQMRKTWSTARYSGLIMTITAAFTDPQPWLLQIVLT